MKIPRPALPHPTLPHPALPHPALPSRDRKGASGQSRDSHQNRDRKGADHQSRDSHQNRDRKGADHQSRDSHQNRDHKGADHQSRDSHQNRDRKGADHQSRDSHRNRDRKGAARLISCAPLALVALLAAADPGPQPKLVGEGAISTPYDETGFGLTPDGKTAFFSIRSGQTASPTIDAICVSHLRNGKWTAPEVAPFSGRFRDVTPAVAPDGSKLFFASNRPQESGDPRDFNIWYVELAGDWKTPHPVGAVNTPSQEFGVSVAANGNLYFASNRAGGKGAYDLYRSRLVNGAYTDPENLGEPVNTAGFELSPGISPDEKTLVFEGLGRNDEIVGVHREYNKGDLFVSRFENGAWTPPCNAGPSVNSGGAESAPAFSADGKTLFFASERGFATLRPPHALTAREFEKGIARTQNGMGNIYEIPSAVLPTAACR